MRFGQWAAVCIAGGLVAVLVVQQTFRSDESGEPSGAPEQQSSSTSETTNDEKLVAPEEKKVDRSLASTDRTLPEFSLVGLDASTWTAETLSGKPWVINFWASWCSPCIEEIPSMNAAYKILKPQGVGMLAINAGEGAETVDEFLQKIAIEFPNILGDSRSLQNWSIRGLPTTIVVNAEGSVIFEALGPREWDDEQLLQRIVEAL